MTLKMHFTRELYLIRWTFFSEGNNDNFVWAIGFLSPRSKNREFTGILLSDFGQNVMTNDSLSIHVDVEMYSSKITTLVRTFISFYLGSKMIIKLFYQKNSHIETVLKSPLTVSYHRFQLMILKIWICMLKKVLSTYLINLMTTLDSQIIGVGIGVGITGGRMVGHCNNY